MASRKGRGRCTLKKDTGYNPKDQMAQKIVTLMLIVLRVSAGWKNSINCKTHDVGRKLGSDFRGRFAEGSWKMRKAHRPREGLQLQKVGTKRQQL